MKGGISWNLVTQELIQTLASSIWRSCPEKKIKKMGQIYTKIGVYQNFYKNSRFKQIIFSKYATNLKTTISQRSLSNLGLLLLLFEFNNFSFLIDIIDNIIITSVSRDQSSGHVIRTYLLYCRSNNLSLYES